MRGAVLALALLATAAGTAGARAQAGDFSARSEATEWGLSGERKARFEGRVVDLLCTLTGDCPEACGGGARQLGLERQADGALIPAAKNGQPLFTGAVRDLLPHCGEVVEVDGLMVGDGPTRVFMVQTLRAPGAAEARPADRWTRGWAEAHPDLAEAPGPWFRKDPRIEALIARDGWLGLGAEADRAFLAEWFQ